MPLMAHGREVQDVRLQFEDGREVEYEAAKNEDVLAAVLDTDDGASRLGELGIGMNRDIDRFTYNMLFDEKMGDTVHMALRSRVRGQRPRGLPRRTERIRDPHGHDRRHERELLDHDRRRNSSSATARSGSRTNLTKKSKRVPSILATVARV